jgi:hypothetical protein
MVVLLPSLDEGMVGQQKMGFLEAGFTWLSLSILAS